jgi:hypothetical protein
VGSWRGQWPDRNREDLRRVPEVGKLVSLNVPQGRPDGPATSRHVH